MKEFFPITQGLIMRFADNPEPVKNYLCKNGGVREIVRATYQYFVNSQQIDGIETLPTPERKRIWETAKSWEQLPENESVKIAKAIYLFENLLERRIE